MILVGKTTKGWWPGAENGQIPGYGNQITSYKSHPYTFAMNSDYFAALASTFENRYGVKFKGIGDGAITDEKERLIQYKENIDVVMSVLDQNGLGYWVAHRLVEIGEQVKDNLMTRMDVTKEPFLDDRLDYRNLSIEPKTVTATNPISG